MSRIEIEGAEAVIDANMVVNLAVVTHPFHESAKRFFAQCVQKKIPLIAPPLFETEVDNTLRLMVSRKTATAEAVALAFQITDALLVEIIQDPDVRLLARSIADQIGHPRVGDATYAALAQLRGCPFWTADGSFARAAEKIQAVHFVGELST